MKTVEPSLGQRAHPSLLAGEWLMHSGIQNVSTQPELRGGVHAWMSLTSHQPAFLYSEITGYAVNAFLFLHDISGVDEYRERAQMAADWLLRMRTNDSELVATRPIQNPGDESYFNSTVFSFDQWMIVYGLCSAWNVFHKTEYLDQAKNMADFLLVHTVKDNGSFYPMFNLERQTPEEPRDKWSRQGGSFLAKALLGLEALYHHTGDRRYFECACKLADSALKDQQPDGRFVTQWDNGSTHLHPYCYTLEGLLPFALKQGRKEIIAAVVRAFNWVLEAQQTNGGIYAFFVDGSFRPFERADVLAQVLRLGSILTTVLPELKNQKNKLKKLRDRLISYQITSGPHKGGFLYGQEENGMIHYDVNTWTTMFAAQSIWLHDTSEKYDFNFFV